MSRVLFLIILTALALANHPALAAENQGFIYGTVTMDDGDRHTGFLRWDVEEAFWDDLFHSRQIGNQWLDHVDLEELKAERRRIYFETHGMLDRIMWTMHNKDHEADISRLFISHFGNINQIRTETDDDGDDFITLSLTDGSEVPIRGYANDVSADLIIYPATGDPVEVEWDDQSLITFFPAPVEAEPYAQRLYGTVKSAVGDFEGFIQWDESECTSTDILDGDERDLAMGEIHSLTRNRRGNSDIVLKNGENITMSGTNDVSDGNRGVMVENPSWGRATVGWNRFQSITFAEGHGSGPGKSAYQDITPLQGTVTDTDGASWTGRIVYDLDEAWSRDIFNGKSDGVVWDIPFSLINTIEKMDKLTCRVSLASGQTLDLTEGQDTGDEHAGVPGFRKRGGRSTLHSLEPFRCGCLRSVAVRLHQTGQNPQAAQQENEGQSAYQDDKINDHQDLEDPETATKFVETGSQFVLGPRAPVQVETFGAFDKSVGRDDQWHPQNGAENGKTGHDALDQCNPTNEPHVFNGGFES